MLKNISFRVARESDSNELLVFLREHYYKEEPLTLSYIEPGHTKDDEEGLISHISKNTVILAIDDSNARIVGAAISESLYHDYAEKLLKGSENCETKKWRDIQKFLAYLQKKADVFNKFKIQKALYCHALAVDRNYRGNKIGAKLLEKSFENGKNLKFELLSADCTSIFSVKICENLGMEMVSVVSYEEFNQSVGENLFYSIEPNVDIKTFVKKL